MKRERKKTGSINGKWIPKYAQWKTPDELAQKYARRNKKQQEYLRSKKRLVD